MRKVIVYTQSLNHLEERVFVARIDDGGVILEEVKALSNIEISEQDIFEINNIIKRYSKDDEIIIYCLSAYPNKKNELKDKWRDSSEGKEFLIKSIINLFLSGSCDTSNENKVGCYIALLSSGDRNKIISGEGQNTTTNRMLLVGLIEVLKILKTPCLIRLYTHTNIGFSGGNTNKDLREKLFKLMIENSHAITEIISDEKQEYLQTLLSEKINIV